jgi:hypothetical protein
VTIAGHGLPSSSLGPLECSVRPSVIAGVELAFAVAGIRGELRPAAERDAL